MGSNDSIFVGLPLLLQLSTLLPIGRRLKARQLEEPVIWVQVLQNRRIFQDDSAAFTKEGHVVDSCLVNLLFVLAVLGLVVLQVSL